MITRYGKLMFEEQLQSEESFRDTYFPKRKRAAPTH